MSIGNHSLNRRSFLHVALGLSAGLAADAWLPQLRTAAAPAGAIQSPVCFETLQSLLDLCATSEHLMATLYYAAITQSNGLFVNLPTLAQHELQAALDEEWHHAALLIDQLGAQPAASDFFFPTGLFDAASVGEFLATVETLESHLIGLYLAAIRRAGELGADTTAATLGQIVAIEAEHRALVREIRQNAPPAPNDRCFEQASFVCAGQMAGVLAAYLEDDGASRRHPLPAAEAVAQAVGSWGGEAVTPVQPAACAEAVGEVIQVAAAAEAVGVSLYYWAISGPFFATLPAHQQWYLQAALDEERRHLDFLVANGAAAVPTVLHFPPAVFDTPAAFLPMLDTLENAFIAAYLAAIQRLSAAGQPLLAEICGQILGVEAQHRLLGRVMAQQRPANNLRLARPAFVCMADAAAALEPFLSGGADHSESRGLPTLGEIDAAVAQFGCTPVAPATAPLFTYAPQIMR